MDPKRTVSPESALASDIFDKFCSANTLKGILSQYRQLCCVLRIKPTHFPDFYPRLRAKLSSWRAQGLWSKFEKRASQKCYGRGKACYGTRVLIIGAGPCGLRSAIEAQLLGAKVVLVEKRDRFSRNNVLHLWPFVITDLKALGAKKFYGKFCAGSIDHISIRQIQCILLKVALLLGVEIHEGVGFEGLREPSENEGWRAVISPADHPVCHYTFDVLIGADGRRNTLEGFKRKALRAKLAIAITANFINKHTEAEARVKEISGVSYIFNQKFFQDLCEATGIDLENIVYYKDETHYFVMTAKKQSLLNKGVLLHDHADTAKLLSHDNINSEALMIYALEAALFATEYQLPDIEFAVNHYGQPDVAMFDFTAMYAAENACRVLQRKGHKLLMTLVGDSLLEPFWPTGSGCARGFLSSFDAGWMLRSWTSGIKSVLDVIAERESIYRLLGQTTPENLQKEHVAYTIDPHTRYPNLNLRLVMPFQVKSLYDADEKIPDVPESSVDPTIEEAPKKRRRDSVIAVDSLLSWLRDQLSCYSLEISDVRDAFVRGDVLCAIVHRFRPDLLEYPLPSEENVDPVITAAVRNQLAFDILQQEYGLPHVMTGFDSVQFVAADFLTLVAYLSQVYEIFRGEIPQTKYLRTDSCEDLDDQQRHNHVHQMKAIRVAVTAKHNFTQKPVGRRNRLSSGKDGDSEPYRRHKKRRSEERSRMGSSADVGSTESSSTKARGTRKMQERIFDVERYIKTMKLLQLSQRSGLINEDDNEENEAYHDYTFHLYRQTVPDFDDRCKNLEKKLAGREFKPVFGRSMGEGVADCDKMVPGMAKDLEAKLKGRSSSDRQKPKDLIRAIGKIEKSDWNIQLIEKKMAEIKDNATSKKDNKDNKVPRWSREAFDDKREAMKRKMEGPTGSEKDNERVQLFEETMKKLGSKLKEGNALEVGQRGCNKVSAMAEQLIHKLERPKQTEAGAPRQTMVRPAFELPKKGRNDLCHFCKERVYVVERMTAEGKFFHRNCFRCEYCNTSLRIGNYVFDREGRYGERFYCGPHYATVRMYGWKKFELLSQEECDGDNKYPAEVHNLLVPPVSQQISEMDERGTTPERAEFENSVDFASEEELLSEDEWTDRNFGASNADNTSDEASDLSDDEEITPDGNKVVVSNEFKNAAIVPEVVEPIKKEVESSDSDTEVASEEEEESDGEEGSLEEEEEDDGDDEDDEEEEDEEECGGSTTEIETDSEFAEDPPHSVPGSIPTIIVDAPEQLVTRMVDTVPINHTRNAVPKKESRTGENGGHQRVSHQRKYADIFLETDPNVEMVKKGAPERTLPVVTAVPKKWEPLFSNPAASKVSIELKKKYLHGPSYVSPVANSTKRATDPAAENQFRSVLDMISEQQKLLQPASKPSATMQAFLDGAEKLKNQTNITTMNRNLASAQPYNLNNGTAEAQEKVGIKSVDIATTVVSPQNDNGNIMEQPKISQQQNTSIGINKGDTLKMGIDVIDIQGENTSTAQKQMEFADTIEYNNHSTDPKQEVDIKVGDDEVNVMIVSDTPSVSQSETDTRSTVINVHGMHGTEENKENSEDEEVESGSDTEVGSGEALSDLDDLDFDDVQCPPQMLRDPPRVEIEDEFGSVTQALEITTDQERLEAMENSANIEPDLNNVKKTDEEDLSENDCQYSSDSSLNSGIFLETEMSEYVKEEDSVAEPRHRKKVAGKKHSSKNKEHLIKSDTPENMDKPSKTKPSFGFDLEALDFADIDGISSPEECRLNSRQSIDSLEQPYVPLPSNDTVQDRFYPHQESQSTPTTDSPSEDDDRSSTSAKEVNENSTSEAETSDNVVNRSSLPKLPELAKVSILNKESNKKSFPSLERVGPFSSARDSLDYRKAKGVTSQLRDNDLYSTYAVPSIKTSVRNTFQDPSQRLEEVGELLLDDSPPMPASSDESYKSNGSPGTARRLTEIHRERAKQNDLIRTMVMGRIKRSPEKSIRRNSKGSSSGTSLHSEATVEKSGDETDSKQSSDNSQCHDGNTSEEYPDVPKSRDVFSAFSVPKDGKHSSFESVNDIPHRPMAESVSSQSDDSSNSRSAKVLLPPQKVQHNYEPVFISSPRFRNRPKFDGQLTICQSITEQPTPTKPLESPFLATNASDDERSNGIYSVRNPLFSRSMPDLSESINFSTNKAHIEQIIQPSSCQTNEIKSFAPEKPKRANQSVLKVKSPTDHGGTRIADYDVFNDTSRDRSTEEVLTKKENYRPRSDIFDETLAASARQDFNSQNFNPFLVTSPTSTFPKEKEMTVNKQRSPTDETRNLEDGFINLHLRFRSKEHPSERRKSPEKSVSICTESLKDMADSGYVQSSPSYSSTTPQQCIYQDMPSQVGNWILEKHESSSRPRAHTLADLHFNTNPMSHQPGGSYAESRGFAPNVRHSIDNSDTVIKQSKSKAVSSDTLLDGPTLSESSGRGTSFPDISGSNEGRGTVKTRKSKDRFSDRRRSLIQAVSDFFSIKGSNSSPSEKLNSGGPSSLTTSTSSSSIVSPSKDKFSLFKLTPKLLQNKDKKASSKSKESILSPTSTQQQFEKYYGEGSNDNYGRIKKDFSEYIAEPNMVIQRLTASPNSSKDRSGTQENLNSSSPSDYDRCAHNMANLSIQPSTEGVLNSDYRRNEGRRAREIEEIDLQLSSIEADQRSLELRGVKIEKKLRGEEIDEENRSDNEIMEEWFAMVREKTRLARFEKELLVRAQELQLEAKKEQLEQQLDNSLLIKDSDKSAEDKRREIEILHEIRRLNEQHGNLLNSLHADMEKYKSEEANSEFSVSPGTSRLESDV